MEYRTAAGRTLNFDFRIRNADQQPLELAEVRLVVSDLEGSVLLDLIINQNGVSPSILTIPNRTIAPGETLTVFNPYLLLPAVHSTAVGVVAFVRDGVREDAEVGIDDIRKDLHTIFGNSVVIDHGNGEFSRFGHLQTGSIVVKQGDRVAPGQVIGRVGNSGASLFPHLHYELASGVGVDNEGLPSTFVDVYRVFGKKRVKLEVSPDTGDIIEKAH